MVPLFFAWSSPYPISFNNVSSQQERAEGPRIRSLGQAVDKAIQEMRTLGYDLAEFYFNVDEKNTLWNKYLKVVGEHPLQRDKLKGLEVVAVYFVPIDRKPTLPTDFWVFVDKRNGEVVASLKGR